MTTLPLFPVTTVGSWPRPAGLVRAIARRRRGELSRVDFEAIAACAVRAALDAQVGAGVDLVTDGEQRRDNFYSFVSEKLEGVRLLSLADMLDVVEDKDAFGRLLATLDVPAFSIFNPTCVGEVRRREPLAVADLEFARRHTDRPVKVTLPGPYILTRAMWVKEVSQAVYPAKENLGDVVVGLLREEAFALRDAGAAFIQFDEPVLTELVFAAGRTRTFMCAALAARKDPVEELNFAVDLINRVVDGLDGVLTGVHVCRGNWSRNEKTLLQGSYHPLVPYLARMHVDQLVLEYATPRAGALVPISGKSLGLGVVNPRSAEVETPAAIVRRVEEALEFVAPDQVFLNPDCGFATFAAREMNDTEIARRKLEAMVEAAGTLRARAACRTGRR
jgi:5-methyltetrahydropteroyltriglutamate--homocysteine methyltransferase